MTQLHDQLGRLIKLPALPKRIVSLVPSQTELLSELGLEHEVVGITKFCIHPRSWFRNKTRVGGTKDLQLPRIHMLQPDLVIAGKEENVQAQIEALAATIPVYISDVHDMDSALQMISDLGTLTGRENGAASVIMQIQRAFEQLRLVVAARTKPPVKVAYLIWQEPYMTVGHDTYIHAMLELAGFENVFAGHTRYPQITPADIAAAGAELVLFSTEPYPFKEHHMQALQAALPGIRTMLADGEMFSWYGSSMIAAAAYFEQLI